MSQQLGNEVERQGKQVNYMIHYYPVVIFLSSNRPALQRFLFHMRQEDGSFIMHDDGEVDISELLRGETGQLPILNTLTTAEECSKNCHCGKLTLTVDRLQYKYP
jgi:prenyltransferase beta subunit